MTLNSNSVGTALADEPDGNPISEIIAAIYPRANEAVEALAKGRLAKKDPEELARLRSRLNDEVTKAEIRAFVEDGPSFNTPATDADFAAWAEKAYWTPEEAAALLLSRNPRLTNWDDIRRYATSLSSAATVDDLADKLKRWVEHERWNGALKAGESMSPAGFYGWALEENFDVPGALEECIVRREEPLARNREYIDELEKRVKALESELSQSKQELEKLGPERDALMREVEKFRKEKGDVFANHKERNSVYELLVGLVFAGWKFNPKLRANDGILKTIVDDLMTVSGIHIHEQTVRKHLKAAADDIDFVPPARESAV